jgi:signal peptidase I
VKRFEVVDRSMEPALSPGDYLLARFRRPLPGEIVVFEHPDRDGFHLVKRVIALAGQRVEIDSGSVSVDGEPRDPAGDLLHTAPDGTWEVPDGHCFVLSDARTATAADSRTFGCIPTDGMWVATLKYWPPRSIQRLA